MNGQNEMRQSRDLPIKLDESAPRKIERSGMPLLEASSVRL